MKEMVPGLLYTHCVAHVPQMAMMDSMKFDDSYLEKSNNNLNGIFKFYYQSTVRQQELKQIAEILEEDFKKFGLLKNVCWISGIKLLDFHS